MTTARASRIYDWLSKRLGHGTVFMDVERIEPGDDYANKILREIRRSNLVLAIIGSRWQHSSDSDGMCRLDRPDDLVRREILTAIGTGVRVVPVLVDGAASLTKDDLPLALHGLAKLNALRLDEHNFNESMLKLFNLAQGSTRDQKGDRSQPVEPTGLVRPSMLIKKVLLLGADGVGKTSLISRYVLSMFSDRYLTTIGVKIDQKLLKIGEHEVRLMIWDTAGEEEGTPVKIDYYRDASGIIYVADGCRLASMETALRIRQRVLNLRGWIPEILAVNKVDLQSEWQVDLHKLSSFESEGLVAFTTSAKTGKGVELLFLHIARKILAIDGDFDGDD